MCTNNKFIIVTYYLLLLLVIYYYYFTITFIQWYIDEFKKKAANCRGFGHSLRSAISCQRKLVKGSTSVPWCSWRFDEEERNMENRKTQRNHLGGGGGTKNEQFYRCRKLRSWIIWILHGEWLNKAEGRAYARNRRSVSPRPPVLPRNSRKVHGYFIEIPHVSLTVNVLRRSICVCLLFIGN